MIQKCESCGRTLPRFKAGDFVRLKHDHDIETAARPTLVFEVRSVDLSQSDINDYAHLVGLDPDSRVAFDELEAARPGEKPVGPRFVVGDKVKVSATLEQFGEHFEDAWRIANGHVFRVKSVFHSPHCVSITYGLRFVSRTIEEGWLSHSSEDEWEP